MAILTFKPNTVTEELLSTLKDRARDVLIQRFGLGLKDNSRGKTLEAIGDKYGITRERVRQLENFAMNSIKKSSSMDSAKEIFEELKDVISQKGKVLSEEEILELLAENQALKNHIYFLLELGDDFTRLKEDDELSHRWTTDVDYADKVRDALKGLHKELNQEQVVSESEMISAFRKNAEEIIEEEIKDEIIRSWLKISKIISSNPMGEWGHIDSPYISPRGVRDLAFLVLRKEGKPLHFNDVAKKIGDYFARQAHSATTHNELIKDPRFILVGRGLYGLSDWGYQAGTVKDMIEKNIKKNGPMTREEIIKAVMKDRFVKENTILVNLQNKNYFKRDKNGKYSIV